MLSPPRTGRGCWAYLRWRGRVQSIVNDHFAPLLEGQDTMAIEKNWDLMRRASSPYGTHGLASYAISAVDNALWDLKGKLLGVPVYELLGGPVKDKIFCYASNTTLTYGTEDYIDWFMELGFKAVKVFVRHGPEGWNRGAQEERGSGRSNPRTGWAGCRDRGGLMDVA